MKINDMRKSMRQLSNNTTTSKKRNQSMARKRLRTFADIKHCIDPTPQSTAFKSNRLTVEHKVVRGYKSSYHHNQLMTENITPEEYFCCFTKNIPKDVLETHLYEELFGLPCIKSMTSKSEANLAITESYEFVEMNNNSIHVSRVFISQLTNSFKTTSNRDNIKQQQKGHIKPRDDKENFRNDEQRIASMLQVLKKNVQFSSLDTSKKQLMIKGIADLGEILNSDDQVKVKYLSQESFGKYLHNKQLPTPIEAFKNI